MEPVRDKHTHTYKHARTPARRYSLTQTRIDRRTYSWVRLIHHAWRSRAAHLDFSLGSSNASANCKAERVLDFSLCCSGALFAAVTLLLLLVLLGLFFVLSTAAAAPPIAKTRRGVVTGVLSDSTSADSQSHRFTSHHTQRTLTQERWHVHRHTYTTYTRTSPHSTTRTGHTSHSVTR
jgi:hypothetical protein